MFHPVMKHVNLLLPTFIQGNAINLLALEFYI